MRSTIHSPEFAVETLHEGVLPRLAWLDEPQAHTGSLGPVEYGAVRDFSGREFLSWDLLVEVRRIRKGRLVAKAGHLGADGVILSNPRGRQLDGAVLPIRVLSAALDAEPSLPIMLDEGVLRGTDVLKTLALSASFVFIGRPFNYAASVAGGAGPRHAIGLLRTQLRADMGIMGLTDLADLDCSFLDLSGFRKVRAYSAKARVD